MSHLTPVAQPQRIVALDVLRGIALCGILLMNMPGFAMAQFSSEAYRSNPADINFWVRAVEIIVFEGKMRALFSAIFGAGIILFTTNKEQSGGSATLLFYRRMFWLALFGLIHAHILLWSGEILYYYGVIGMIAFLFRKMKPVYLAMAIPIVAIAEFILTTQFMGDIRDARLAYVEAAVVAKADSTRLTEDQRKAIGAWQQLEKDLIPNREIAAENTRKMKSDYSTVASYVRKISWDGQTKYLIYGIWDPLALMLLGMALYKWGFLTLQWSRKAYIKTLLIGYGLGFPLVTWSFYDSFINFPNHEAFLSHLEQHAVNWMNLIYPVQRILLMMGHAALILLLFQSGVMKGLFERLRAVGQMAFTNYIVHTLICTFIFFGYGLNYFGEVEYYKIYYVVFAIWGLQLIYSPLWLKRYLFGPLEWVWRTLTYWAIQPMRRSPTAG